MITCATGLRSQSAQSNDVGWRIGFWIWRFACGAVLLGISLNLFAQLTRSTISGVVTDPSGAAIPSAHVKIYERYTHAEREAFSNSLGIYRLVAVEPGTYTVAFSATGFKTLHVNYVLLRSAEDVILNQRLAIADETAQIDVREFPIVGDLIGSAPAVNRTFDQETIAAAPLSSGTRDPRDLALFVPLASRAPGFSGISAGGQRSRNQNFLLDGTDINELTVTGSNIRLIPEAVSEIQIQYPAYSAEFGRNSGAQVSAYTRRGNNALHGEIWDNYRANWMDPLSLLDKRIGFKDTPRFVHHQAGGSLGGPLRTDRSFFFGLLEASRYREGPNTRNAQPAVIPTVNGYAALRSIPLGTGQSVASRQEVLNALSFLRAVYQDIGQYESLFTQSVNSIPIEFGSVRVPLAEPNDFWYGLLRWDHKLSVSSDLNYRFNFDKRTQRDSTGNLQFGIRFAAASKLANQNHAVSLVHAFGPDWINESRSSYARNNSAFSENDPTSPTVQISGAFTFGGLASFPQGRIANSFQWQNVTTHVRRRHLIKFGIELRRNRLYNIAAFDSKGTWTFNNFSDFVNNRPSRLRQSLTDSTYDARQTNQSYFVQDEFRLKPTLSLNLGLRYEVSGMPFGYFGTVDKNLQELGIPGPARRDVNNFAPRFGFAFIPEVHTGWGRWLLGEQQTVLRGGYGVNYDVIYFNVLTITASNYPRAVKYDIFAPETIDLYPQLFPKQTSIPAFDPLRFPFANTPSDIKNPTSSFWTFSIQRQVGINHTYEIGYAGNRAYHLLRQSERNPGVLTDQQAAAVINGQAIPGVQMRRLNPAWASRATIESTAVSKHHAFYARLDRKMLKGLYATANYAWSGTFSDNDEPLAIGDIVLSSPQLPQSVFDYKNEWSRSIFDRPHRLAVLSIYEFRPTNTLIESNTLLKQIVSGWTIGVSGEWQSGQPFTVTTGVDSGGSGIPIGWRPDVVPGGRLEKDPVSGNLRTFRAEGVFSTPRTSNGFPLANSMPRGGNLGRNSLRGPSFTSWNLSLAKSFEATERVRIQFRGDFVNIWNHRNFGNPVATMNSSAFGTNTTNPDERSVILGAKLFF